MYPEFVTEKSKDLMIRLEISMRYGMKIKDAGQQILMHVINLIDEACWKIIRNSTLNMKKHVPYMRYSSSGSIDQWWKFVKVK